MSSLSHLELHVQLINQKGQPKPSVSFRPSERKSRARPRQTNEVTGTEKLCQLKVFFSASARIRSSAGQETGVPLQLIAFHCIHLGCPTESFGSLLSLAAAITSHTQCKTFQNCAQIASEISLELTNGLRWKANHKCLESLKGEGKRSQGCQEGCAGQVLSASYACTGRT